MRSLPLSAQAGVPSRGAFAECPPAPARPGPVSSGKVNEAFVILSAGLPAGDYPMPPQPVALEQAGCEFVPRVFGIRAGQDLAVRNADPTLHNVHAGRVFNVSMPQRSPAISLFFPRDGLATVTCDVHPWMRAYAGVSTHPFFAVTGPDGAFALRGLPAGNFTLTAWHERMGRASVQVDLKESQTARVEISLDAATPGG